MKHANAWTGDPEVNLPDPKNIIDVIKWHIALGEEMEKECPTPKGIVQMKDIRPSNRFRDLVKMERIFFEQMDYCQIAQIEVCMLIGREIFCKNRTGHSVYDRELSEINVWDLTKWAEVFSIPLTEAAGGDKRLATEYTLSKKPMFLQAYIDSLREE